MSSSLLKCRIAVIAEDYPPNQGGIAEYSANLVWALARQGHDVHVVSAHVSGDEQADKLFPTTITRIGEKDIRRRSLGLLARRQAVARFQKELDAWMIAEFPVSKPDFAIVSSVSVWAEACVRWGLPYAICVHGGDAFGKRSDFIRSVYRDFAVRSALVNASRIFTNSDFTAGQVSSTAGIQHNIVTTYCGVSHEFIEATAEANVCGAKPHNRRQLLMMCRLVPIKACDVVLEAIARLVGKYPDIHLCIAGDGPLRNDLESLASRLGIRNNVEFLGYISDVKNKSALFRDSELLVQSGRIDPKEGRPEAFGIVFAEAGVCCRAVVGPRLGGVPEVIEDGVTGYLVNPDSPDRLAAVIDKMLSDPLATEKMGIAGRERVLNKFSYARIAQTIVQQMKQFS